MPEDRRMIDDDIANWMSEMQVREKDLEEGKALSSTLEILQPEIRQVSTEPVSFFLDAISNHETKLD